jgi:transposase
VGGQRDVRLDVAHLVNEVKLAVKPNTVWTRPQCKARMHIMEWRTRCRRHLDSCRFKAIPEAAVPLVKCAEHGAQTVQVPWAKGSSRFTRRFERFAIRVPEACPTARAVELPGIGRDEADGIKQRAVRRGLGRRRQLDGLEYVCVDEKAVGRGQDYVTVATGAIGGEPRVPYVGDGRDEAALNGFRESPGPNGCTRIKAVGMDMGQPCRNSTRRYCRNAEPIFDPFHSMRMSNKAVDAVRRREIVPGTVENRNIDDAHVFFRRWYAMAIRSKPEPVKKATRSFKARLADIASIFRHGFCNALAEGIDSRIRLLMRKSCGYRNRERLKADILFRFGGLDMEPLTVR